MGFWFPTNLSQRSRSLLSKVQYNVLSRSSTSRRDFFRNDLPPSFSRWNVLVCVHQSFVENASASFEIAHSSCCRFNLIGLNEEAGVGVRFQLEAVAQSIRNEFEQTFDVSHVVEMDCSKSRSDRMKDCRQKLKKVAMNCSRYLTVFFLFHFSYFSTQTADEIPKLCYAIENNLSLSDEKRKRPFAYFFNDRRI